MLNVQDLAGKVAVVTGAASGIGKAIARRLVAQGMRVIVADVEQAALDQAAQELGAIGIRTDVSSLESVQALADQVVRRFGAVHVFCSNAGVGSVARIADMTPQDWTWLLGVNLWGTIHGIKAFLPLLNANAEGGRLVITASEAGFHTLEGLGAYAASKFAVVAVSETLALELERDQSRVRVTLLCPGPVRSRLGSSQRNRPGGPAAKGLVDSDLEHTEAGRLIRWVSPDVVADGMIHAFENDQLYVFTHPELFAGLRERHEKITAAFDDAAAYFG